ncbi:uncharacterized protein LOC109799506 [Cajanus cajan]|uniref:uncharacterized protein LOC109799506 n=1 Tax=Cajanus cajan TaxID=3821 RepID=UPI00098D8994|nr:uncharacterized protein LOC109799506 [Cajanus cajan]
MAHAGRGWTTLGALSVSDLLFGDFGVAPGECFRRVFLEKYFLENVRHAKEAKFMRLHQGGLKFAEGLKQELKRVVVPMAITEFPALVEKAKVVERLEGGNRVTRTVEGPAESKREGNQRKSDCPHTESRYFRCHQMGHESTNCPAKNRLERDTQRSGAQRGDAQRGDRPTTARRVFALTRAEASSSSDLVKGKGNAASKDVMILFDSGVSHYFISYACVAMLGVPMCNLGLRLLVSTPASASVVTSKLCAGCPVVVNEKRYKEADLSSGEGGDVDFSWSS